MTNGDALEARVVELETRIAFLEGTLAEMSDALAAARIEAQRNADLFRRALEEMKSSRAGFMADPADEPPPPHY
ncbi:Protein SlyX-like protein [Lysobacter dokdonensis DS-58]|uniref:Protein SlyX homolog n=1 Tax=Lysobacter dokdonensis DS-58 TaxID=1300345 RepID=A0A0A2X4Z5_9GAMM|nr:SlyX family protein [Lysobacter dokdonensis]KGQ20324.1 Protein SlyX-like protein [Lysobacter dokdonensis DS-58]